MMVANTCDVTIVAEPTLEIVDVVDAAQNNSGNRIVKCRRERTVDGIATKRTASVTLHLPLRISLKDVTTHISK